MQVPDIGLLFGGQSDCQTVLLLPSRGFPSSPANWESACFDWNAIFPIGLSYERSPPKKTNFTAAATTAAATAIAAIVFNNSAIVRPLLDDAAAHSMQLGS